MDINYDAITLEDCENLYHRKNQQIVIEDGHITQIIKEEA